VRAVGVDEAFALETLAKQQARLVDGLATAMLDTEDPESEVIDLMAALKASNEKAKKRSELLARPVIELAQICPEHKARLGTIDISQSRRRAWCPEGGGHETDALDVSLAYEFEPGSYVELVESDQETLGLAAVTGVLGELNAEGCLVVRVTPTDHWRHTLQALVDLKLDPNRSSDDEPAADD